MPRTKTPQKSQAGRPTKYRPEYDEMVFRLCLLGATDVEMASVFQIEEQTFYNWQKQYPTFLESIRRGKIDADAKVAERLFQRATGYTHPEVKVFYDSKNEEVVKEEITKHYPPDTAAAFIWLKNRRTIPQNKENKAHLVWRDKTEVANTYPDGIPINMNDDKARLTRERMLAELNQEGK